MGQVKRFFRTGGDALQISSLFVALLFLVELCDVLFRLQLDYFGIIPREWIGLRGIIFSPLLHYNWAHLLANASSILALMTILFWSRRYKGASALFTIWILSGFGTWLIGRPAIHIGASSLIYGFVAFLVASAYWMRNWKTALVAVLILILYGGIVFGMIPQRGFISWEGHLCGALAGWLAAWRQHA